MNRAPIILFCYNRPEHVRQTLKSLKANALSAESELYVFSDGPKENASSETIRSIEQVRQVIREEKWCANVHIKEAEHNLGLATSVIQGVSTVIEKYGKVIVVEDDVLLSPYFLDFMNEALDKYEHDERVMSIGSWNYFCSPKSLDDNFFLRYPDSIAWACFERSWKLFESDSVLLLQKLKEQKRLKKLNADGKLPYFEDMLQQQIAGRIDSWAIRWTGSCVLHGGLNFYPKHSLSKHLGFGQGATHETGDDDYNRDLEVYDQKLRVNTQNVQENQFAFRAWCSFIKKLQGISLQKRIVGKLKSLSPAFVKNIYKKLK